MAEREEAGRLAAREQSIRPALTWLKPAPWQANLPVLAGGGGEPAERPSHGPDVNL
jgi:hypothetical protein